MHAIFPCHKSSIQKEATQSIYTKHLKKELGHGLSIQTPLIYAYDQKTPETRGTLAILVVQWSREQKNRHINCQK